ncbi:MAG: RidA family protein [Kiritimatiellae bacterium]|nr:RidA family protein [Kiritimatiellia bacterium]
METVQTDKAPKVIGPYSQAVTVDGFVFCSGQIPIKPQTGELVRGDIREEVRQVMSNLRVVLEAADSSLARVVRTTIYLTDIGLFPQVNEVYGTFFQAPYPARATVGVAALPKGARVEIDVVAKL